MVITSANVKREMSKLRVCPNRTVINKIINELKNEKIKDLEASIIQKIIDNKDCLKAQIAISKKEYLSKPKDFRGIWTSERYDQKGWEEDREFYVGKKTLMISGCNLLIEGMHFYIVE